MKNAKMDQENPNAEAFFNRIDQNTLTNVAREATLGNAALLRKNLREGQPHDVCDNRGWFPIHRAASAGHNSCVKILLEHNEQNFKDTKTYNGETPLFLAATNGHCKVMTTLLQHNADNKIATNELSTVLIAAVKGRNKQCIKICLDNKMNVDGQDAGGWAAIHEAAYIGDKESIKTLLAAGAKINIQNSDKATPLFIAAQHGHLECMKTLINHEAKIHLSTKDKATPLFIASQEGHVECVRALLDAGAKVKHKTTSQATALHTAAERGHVDVIRLLIKAGADVNAKSEQDVTPLFLAADENQVQCLIELIEAGADMNAQLKEDRGTPLELACTVGSLNCCQELINRGCNPDRVFLRNGTLETSTLMETIDAEVFLCAEILLKHGADPNRLTYSYPIITAAKNCDPESLSLLLEYGADVDAVDQAGNSALMMCVIKSLWPTLTDTLFQTQLQCIKIILKAGADTEFLLGSKSPFIFAMDIDRLISTQLISLLLQFVPHEAHIKEYVYHCLHLYVFFERQKIEKITEMLENPCSLMHLCRLKVRKMLGRNRLVKIDELPVPKMLHHYLKFQSL